MNYTWRDFRQEISKFPNVISILRMFLPFIIYNRMEAGEWQQAMIWLQVGIGSDMVDGWAARRYGWVTRLGKVFDPLADKIFIVSISLLITPVELNWWIWLLFFLEGILLLIGAAAFYAQGKKGVELGANYFGKAKFFHEGLFLYFLFAEKLGWKTQFRISSWLMFNAPICLVASVVGAFLSILLHFRPFIQTFWSKKAA